MMEININKLHKYIILSFSSLFFIFNSLIAKDSNTCPSLSISENFFNNEIIGYYLSAIDIDTGESNVLLFDYNIFFDNTDSSCDFTGSGPSNGLSVKFDIEIDIPNYTDGKIALTEGIFHLREINSSIQSISFRNTDISLDTRYLPGGVKLVMEESDYEVNIDPDDLDNLASEILSSGRIPNGRYYFKFEVLDADGNSLDELVKDLDIYVPSYLSLISPGSTSVSDTLSSQVYLSNPIFQWSADYCSNCSNYFIRVCEYTNEHNSLQEAINDLSILPSQLGFYDTENTGNTFQYPLIGVENLQLGKKYVWQIKRSFETTFGTEDEFSNIFIFKMNSFDDDSDVQDVVSEDILNSIKLLIGNTKYNELFNNDGLLYNFKTAPLNIDVNGQTQSVNYLLELIEMLTNGNIQILEVDVE